MPAAVPLSVGIKSVNDHSPTVFFFYNLFIIILCVFMFRLQVLPDEGARSPEMELQTVVSCHVGAGD